MERELILGRTRAGLDVARLQGRVGGQAPDDRRQGSSRPKAIGKWDAATRGGSQLRRVGPHLISMGAGHFADVSARDRS
jgi:hypothetical protein